MPAPRRYLTLVALTLLYFLGGKLGLGFFGLVHPSASAVWIPSGIAIAALLVLGYRVWPAIFIGAFVVNVTTAGSTATSLGVALGNTLEGVIVAALVNRFAHGARAFEAAPDVIRFMVLALLGTTTSATIGVSSLTLGGYAAPADFGTIWLTWWLGDASGAVIVAPLLMLWYNDRRWNYRATQLIEATMLAMIVVSVGALTFFTAPLAPQPLAFLCLPPLVWAAFRFGPREVATAVALLSVLAISATITGHGPLVMHPPNDALLVLQAFMIIAAMTAMPMAALVAERRILLEQERVARAAAEAANRSKDQFLAMLGHELRNPLGAITAATAVIARLTEWTDAVRWIEIVRRQTDHLTRIIDDLLDTARISTGKMNLLRRPVNVANAVEHCMQGLRLAGVLAHSRIEIDSAPVWVHADPDRLNQIIGNLITNAVKCTMAGGQVRVRTFSAAAHAVIRIEDTGIGIDAALLSRIFEPFEQGGQDLARSQGGIGIGLTLVRRLVELHDGVVEAASEGPGRGSVFTVRLPQIAAPADTTPATDTIKTSL